MKQRSAELLGLGNTRKSTSWRRNMGLIGNTAVDRLLDRHEYIPREPQHLITIGLSPFRRSSLSPLHPNKEQASVRYGGEEKKTAMREGVFCVFNWTYKLANSGHRLMLVITEDQGHRAKWKTVLEKRVLQDRKADVTHIAAQPYRRP